MIPEKKNLFLVNVSILYALTTPKNQRLSGVFSGYKMGTLARNNGLKCEKEYELFYGQNCLGKHLVRVHTRITSIMKTYNLIVTATVNFIDIRNLIIQCVKQIFLQSNFRIMNDFYNIIIYQSYFLMSY